MLGLFMYGAMVAAHDPGLRVTVTVQGDGQTVPDYNPAGIGSGRSGRAFQDGVSKAGPSTPLAFSQDRNAASDDAGGLFAAVRIRTAASCSNVGLVYSAADVSTAILLMGAFAWVRSGPDTITVARRSIYFSGMCYFLIFSMAIPNSLELAASFGHGPAISGWFISIMMGGACLGSTAVWIHNRSVRDGSLYSMPGWNFSGASLAVLGTGTYAVWAWFAEPGVAVAYGLIGARFVTGFGCGSQYFAKRFFLNRTAESSEMTDINVSYLLATIVGLAVGPLLVAQGNAIYVHACRSEVPASKSTENQGMAVVAFALVVEAFCFPATEEFSEYITVQEPNPGAGRDGDEAAEETEAPNYRLTILACGIVGSGRAFAVSSLEAATAMLYHEKFGLSDRVVGLLLSASFFPALPLRFVFDGLSASFSPAAALRTFMGFAILGSFLIREDVGLYLADRLDGEQSTSSTVSRDRRVAVLVAADSVLFPALYIAGAYVESIGYRFATPEGTLFSTNNFTLAMTLMSTGVGLTLGPPTARNTLNQSDGQTMYSWHQFGISVVMLLLVEVFVMKAIGYQGPKRSRSSILSIQQDGNSKESTSPENLAEKGEDGST